jgi:hypothetical protein
MKARSKTSRRAATPFGMSDAELAKLMPKLLPSERRIVADMIWHLTEYNRLVVEIEKASLDRKIFGTRKVQVGKCRKS